MGQRVVITGSTRGIGRGLAHEFAARGASVTISGRNAATVDDVVAELQTTHGGDRVTGTACDVTVVDQLEALWQHAVNRFGGVDLWINNAGVSAPRQPLWTQSATAIATTIETNLTGALLGSAVAIRGMLDQGSGQLWNVEGFGSDNATQPGMAAYGSTKRAIRYLQKALVKETKDTPIQICTMSPGIVVTDLLVGDYEIPSPEWDRARKIFNILGDDVETVTPWLVDQMLHTNKSGARVAWLTRGKAARRFMSGAGKKRDLFAHLDGPVTAADVDRP